MPNLGPTCHCTASNTCLCVRPLYHRDGSILEAKKWQHMKEAKAMTYSCYQMYARQPTGLSPEFVEFLELTEPVPDERVGGNIGMRVCCMLTHDPTTTFWAGVARAYVWPWREWGGGGLAGRQLLLWYLPVMQGLYYNLRPEVIESLFYLHQITGNPVYREWGWKIFTSIET